MIAPEDRARGLRWYHANKDSAREANRAWCAANREKRLEHRRKSYWKTRDPEAIRARAKRKRLENPEINRRGTKAWREKNRDKMRALVSAWAKANPDKIQAGQATRRALKKSTADGTVTAKAWAALKSAANNRCTYCGETFVRLTMDHVIPLSRGGTHTLSNIVPACSSCNSRKNTKLLAEFVTETAA